MPWTKFKSHTTSPRLQEHVYQSVQKEWSTISKGKENTTHNCYFKQSLHISQDYYYMTDAHFSQTFEWVRR